MRWLIMLAFRRKNSDGMRLDCLHTPLDLWQQVYQVNVFAPVMLTQQLADCLRAGAGSVVNVTSIAGGRVHEFAGSAYATSKAALGALTRKWHLILAVRVSGSMR